MNEFFLSPHNLTRRHVYDFPRLTNRHWSAFPSAVTFFTVAWVVPHTHPSSIFSAGFFGGFLVDRVAIMCERTTVSPSRARSLQFYAGHETKGQTGRARVKGARYSAENRLVWEIMGHRGVPQDWRREILSHL